MPAFVSTCRKPRQRTRRIARLLALLLGSKYENRGKRSVGEVMERADLAGFSRVAFLHERHGALSRIEFYDAGLGWLPEILEVKGAEIPESRFRVPPEFSFKAEDRGGGEIARLFQMAQSEVEGLTEGAGVLAILSSDRLEFSARGEKRLSMDIRLATAKSVP
ncbi:MAG: hypothetical protein V1787_05510 [Candidatus Micrarchaeota archaeon]